MSVNLSFVLVHVPTIKEVRPFYTEMLGLTVRAEQPGFVSFNGTDGQGATLALSEEDPNAKPSRNPELWWFVDDVEALHTSLAAKGVPVLSAPHDEPFGRACEVSDPAGNTVYLLQLPQG